MRLVDVRADVVMDGAPRGLEVLLAGWPIAAADALSAELRLRGLPARTVNVASLSALAARGEKTVLALGPELQPGAALEVLRDIVRADAGRAWVVVALASGDEPELFQELVDQDRIFFLSSAPPSTVDTADLLAAASTLEERAAARHTAIRADVAQLFRREALDQYQRGRSDEAHLLEVEPRWTRHAYRVVLALIGAALLFSVVIYTRFW